MGSEPKPSHEVAQEVPFQRTKVTRAISPICSDLGRESQVGARIQLLVSAAMVTLGSGK